MLNDKGLERYFNGVESRKIYLHNNCFYNVSIMFMHAETLTAETLILHREIVGLKGLYLAIPKRKC